MLADQCGRRGVWLTRRCSRTNASLGRAFAAERQYRWAALVHEGWRGLAAS